MNVLQVKAQYETDYRKALEGELVPSLVGRDRSSTRDAEEKIRDFETSSLIFLFSKFHPLVCLRVMPKQSQLRRGSRGNTHSEFHTFCSTVNLAPIGSFTRITSMHPRKIPRGLSTTSSFNTWMHRPMGEGPGILSMCTRCGD